MAAQVLSQQELVAEIQKVLGLHKQGLTDKAIEGYERIIPMIGNGGTKVSLLGNVGALQMNKGNWEKAREHFAAAVDIAPDNAQAHFNLAVILTSKLNQHGKALKHCALAMRLDKNNHKAYHLMGNILQNLGKPEEAERYFLMAESIAGDKEGTVGSGGSENVQSSSDSNKARGENLALTALIDQLKAKFDAREVVEIDINGRIYRLQLVSKIPFAFMVDNFLTEEECDYIRTKAVNSLEKSFVMGNNVKPLYTNEKSANNEEQEQSTIASEMSDEDPTLYRSSYNTWLPQDDLLSTVQERLATLLSIPLGYVKQKSEDLQVVKYNIGGQFKPHQDSSSFHPRLLTALMYLNDLAQQDVSLSAEGGETWFPFAHVKEELTSISIEEAVLKALNVYEDSNQGSHLPGVKIAPRTGRILVFFNFLANGKIDPLAVHAGLPIKRTNGNMDKSVTKWIANYWLDYDESILRQFN